MMSILQTPSRPKTARYTACRPNVRIGFMLHLASTHPRSEGYCKELGSQLPKPEEVAKADPVLAEQSFPLTDIGS